MSRIGKQPVKVPAGVKVGVQDGTIAVEGPQGRLDLTYHRAMKVEYDASAGEVRVLRPDDTSENKALHGLTRALIANMVRGVTQGFTKRLEIYGVGYGCRLEGDRLMLNLGYANPIEVLVPKSVKVQIEVGQTRGNETPAKLTISGPDKQALGQFAADIRRHRPPEPYKGKGVRFEGEQIHRKAGKALAGGAA